MKRLLKLSELLYNAIPDYLQFIYRPGQILMRNLCNFRIKLWALTGVELNSQQELAVLYAGDGSNMNYFMELAFAANCKVRYLGKVWLFQIPKLAKRKKDIYSMLIAEVPKFLLLNVKDCFRIPCWVRGEVDISGDIGSIMLKDHSLKYAQRLMRKNELSFEEANEPSRLSNFYYDMYLPYITKRFGNSALLENYQSLLKEFTHCDLILIKCKDQEIAGSLIAYKGRKARLWCFGIKDANPDYVKMGAFGALYSFSFQYLKDKGFKNAGVGGSRPFLKDGVLNYKRKWGLRITEPFEFFFLLKAIKITEGSKAFLVNNPFIYINKGEFNCAVFLDESASSNKNILEVINKNYNYHGISHIITKMLNSNPPE
jgi:hypothetical protein